MNIFEKYETPIWTLIGAIIGSFIGFFLSYLQNTIQEKRKYKKHKHITIEKIKSVIHLPDNQRARYLIEESLPYFSDIDKIEILREIGFESSLNSQSDNITSDIIEKFRFICIIYELILSEGLKLDLRYKEEKRKIYKIHSSMWDISSNIIEYRQSEDLLKKVIDLLKVLYKYSIYNNDFKLTMSGIQLVHNIGQKSIGIYYAQSEYKKLDFNFGIIIAKETLKELRMLLANSKMNTSLKERLIQNIAFSINNIEIKYNNRNK